jgi:adenylate cyclase
MDKKKQYRQIRKLYLVFGAAFFALLAIMFSFYSLLETVDQQLSDMIYQMISYQSASNTVDLISVDDTSIAQLGEYSTWSRKLTAQLITTLNTEEHAPAVIGIDLDYSSSKDSEGDQALLEVCRVYKNVCFSASVTMEETPKRKKGTSVSSLSSISASDISLPYATLLPYIKTGVINNTLSSSDGIARNAITSINVNGTEYDSFAVATYKMYMDSLGTQYSLPEVDEGNSFAFTYTKQSKDYNVYSFYDVISGNVDVSVFDNKIVYVGDYTNPSSAVKTPLRQSSQMQQIEVQANILEALLTQRTGRAVSRPFTAVFYAIFAAVFFLATAYSSNFRTMLAAVLLMILQIIICGVLNIFGYYILVLIPISLVVIITIFNLSVRYGVTRHQRYKMEKAFKKYVDKSVVNEIVHNGALEAKIGGVRKDIAVLFVDIRGFTSLSESLPPEQIVEILNQYLTLAANAVEKNSGTLDKFIGDAAMAVFNSPFDLEDYEYKAVHAAWDLLLSAKELNEFCQTQYDKQVTFGIGIQCGEAVIGNIGCESRMDYTAIGDTVNTASRLEGVAAPGQILISEEMNERLNGRIQTSFAGEFSLKGKKNKVNAYSVDGIYEKLP